MKRLLSRQYWWLCFMDTDYSKITSFMSVATCSELTWSRCLRSWEVIENAATTVSRTCRALGAFFVCSDQKSIRPPETAIRRTLRFHSDNTLVLMYSDVISPFGQKIEVLKKRESSEVYLKNSWNQHSTGTQRLQLMCLDQNLIIWLSNDDFQRSYISTSRIPIEFQMRRWARMRWRGRVAQASERVTTCCIHLTDRTDGNRAGRTQIHSNKFLSRELRKNVAELPVTEFFPSCRIGRSKKNSCV